MRASREFDADTDGNLSLEEFQALWAEITKPLAVRAFQFLDPDGDAAIAKAELDDRFGIGRQPTSTTTTTACFRRRTDRHHGGPRMAACGGARPGGRDAAIRPTNAVPDRGRDRAHRLTVRATCNGSPGAPASGLPRESAIANIMETLVARRPARSQPLLLAACLVGYWRAKAAGRRAAGGGGAARAVELEGRIGALLNAQSEMTGRMQAMAEMLGGRQAELSKSCLGAARRHERIA